MADINVLSNLKIITSGNTPTTDNLKPGEAAFGKLTSDGKYHLFGNTGEGTANVGKVVDIVLDTCNAISAADIDTVLKSGDTTVCSIKFKQTEAGAVLLTVAPTGITVGTTTVTKDGFLDNGSVVLSAKAGQTISAADATTMRGYLSTYSKSEVDGLVAGTYHTKGSVDAFNKLPTNAKAGDVYNIKTSGGIDMHGNAIKAGDNVVYVVNSSTEKGWDVLSGVVDLSGYYTKTEVDNSLKNYAKSADVYTKTEVDDKVSELNTAINGKVSESDVAAYLTNNNYVKDASYVHTDKNYTAADQTKVSKILTSGEGTKVLTDKGTYESLKISVVSI